MKNKQLEQKCNLRKTYTEHSDKIGGRSDNCSNTAFQNSIKNFIFLRECRQCDMKKIILA
ncbi:hypothetical protein [Bacillus thuringiensis]|uniref:hypothetical protein n=1 Tax=Bacillus thuringiensis TaxID=1428 RepID=UPI000BF61C80|nr:hypothetical protein [Bacillus thuringiensis]PFV45512.1 hypothetical protein COL03_03945 [Bacillus thuringiensis]